MDTLNDQLLVGTIMVIVSVALHVIALAIVAAVIKWFSGFLERFHGAIAHGVPAILFGLGVTVVHIAEIWAWAGMFLYIGAIEGLEAALYFSTVTATTVGYGDLVLAPEWRLLGSFEAMFGIVAFGISTAFLIAVLRSSFSRYLD